MILLLGHASSRARLHGYKQEAVKRAHIIHLRSTVPAEPMPINEYRQSTGVLKVAKRFWFD